MEDIRTKPSIVATGFAFAENPRWRDGRLWFVDIHGGRVVAMDPGGEVETIVATPFSPSGIGFAPDGALLIVAVQEMQIMRFKDGALSLHADLSHLARCGMNDMLVDPAGRAYAVQYGFDWRAGEAPKAVDLLTVAPDGAIAAAAPDLMTGNGMALSPDGRTFYIAESGACRISAFDRDAQGVLSNRRIFAQLPDGQYPDGICLDDQGGVWAALAWGPGVVRADPSGAVTHLIRCEGGRNAFACTFGGPDRRTLYICTAEGEEPHEAKARMSSRIEAIDTGFAGAGQP